MRRRDVLLFGAIVLAGGRPPRIASAQQSPVPVVGFLSSRSPGESASVVAAFRDGLREAGFVEERNLRIVFRWAEGRYDRLPALATELVDLRVAVIFSAGGPPTAFAAKAATSTIPIIFSAVSNPVDIGLVRSLSRPDANITGMAVFNASLSAKRLELAKELAPSARVFAHLLNPRNPSAEFEERTVTAAARALGVEFHLLKAINETELDNAFAAAAALRVEAICVAGEPFFDSQRNRIVALAARHAIPALFAWREHVAAGGLMSYGTDLPDSYRQAGIYAGRVLKGASPGDLPVAQPTKFYLAVNLGTAKALGLAVPPSLLARADEVIE